MANWCTHIQYLCEVSDCNENHNRASVPGSRSLPVQSMVWILRLSMVSILRLRLRLVGIHCERTLPAYLFLFRLIKVVKKFRIE